MIKDIVKEYGHLDILVNNAGITKDGLIMKMKEEDFDSVLNVNLKGTFNTIRHSARQMLKQRSGKIINISSVSGILGNVGQANYAASKAGVIGLTKTMARELGSRGITVNAGLEEDLSVIPDEKLLLKSENSLGHGVMDDIQDVIYVKTEGYSASNNQLIAYDIEKLNRRFLDEGKHYILVGPGRWGSSDTWLGIPVKWPNISAARIIVEAGLTNYRVDPSQGTHFFQNLTSFGVGYFTINAYMNDGIYNQALLDSMPAVEETKYLRWVRFEKPLSVKMDGKKKLGVVELPED
jgi:hypothetical protein